MPVTFQILRSNDDQLLSSILAMIEDTSTVTCTNLSFNFYGSGSITITATDVAEHPELSICRGKNVRILERVRIENNFGQIEISREKDVTAFDRVEVNGKQGHNGQQFAPLTVFAQQHLRSFSANALSDVLGDQASVYLKARDVSLARLEGLIGDFMRGIHDARLQQESEISERRRQLEDQFEASKQGFAEEVAERRSELENERNALSQKEASLNLQEPKAERRRVFEELKSTLVEWTGDFRVSNATNNKRYLIHGVLIIIIGTLLVATGTFLVESISLHKEASVTELIMLYVRTAVLLVLTVGFVTFYIGWNNQWFQRHAEEEFRLKRMQLDLKRAHWFTELAFQWRDEYQEPLPENLVDRLTRQLFVEETDGKEHVGDESIASSLLASGATLNVGPTGTELSIGKSGKAKSRAYKNREK